MNGEKFSNMNENNCDDCEHCAYLNHRVNVLRNSEVFVFNHSVTVSV
jgi:hypothetical protein